MKKKHVVIVDHLDDWNGSVPITLLDSEGVKVNVAKTVREAEVFFNGTTPDVLVVGEVVGVREFVQSVRRFREMRIIGLVEQRAALTDIGCNCFVDKATLPTSIRSFLGR